MALNPQLLRESFVLVVERDPKLVHNFYNELFGRYPQARKLFFRKPLEHQEKMLTEALVAVIDKLEDAPWLKEKLAQMGSKHEEYGVTPEMYGWVGESLLATMARAAGKDWTKAHESAWTEAYGAITQLMLAGTTGAVQASR